MNINIYVDEDAQSFETPIFLNSVTAPSPQVLLVSQSLQYQHNNTAHRPGQKLPPPLQ